ncbi:hypothetical protein B0H13DRAFT_2380670 [Mycena leptocephala]|nr:hypothetical protein B0H13DRAFT_2380670 [Mycena leptocephala]
MPSHHVACIKSGRYLYEGWVISTLARVRTSVRIMALVFWGPQGVFLFSDSTPQSLIISAANTAALLVTTARFGELLDETMQNFYTHWFLPAGFWEALMFATDNVLGVNAAPVSKAVSVPASVYPAVPQVFNRICANQHWYDLLTKDWGILPGQPFTWEPTVSITDLTPAQAEEEAVQQDVQVELQQRHSTLLERQLALEADVAQSIDAAEAELAIKREKRCRRAEADTALVIEAAKEVAQEAADGASIHLSADELVALLQNHGIRISRHPYVVAWDPVWEEYTVPIPCAMPTGHTQAQAEAKDGHLLLRCTLIEAVMALSLSQLHQISRAVSTLDTQSLLWSILSELDPSPSPPTQNSDMQHYLQRNHEERDALPGSNPSHAGSPQSLPPWKHPAPPPHLPGTPFTPLTHSRTMDPTALLLRPRRVAMESAVTCQCNPPRQLATTFQDLPMADDAPLLPSDEEDEDYAQTPALQASASLCPCARQVMLATGRVLVPSSSQVQGVGDHTPDPDGMDVDDNPIRMQTNSVTLLPVPPKSANLSVEILTSFHCNSIHLEVFCLIALHWFLHSFMMKEPSTSLPFLPDSISIVNLVNLDQGKASDVFGARPDDKDLMWDQITAAMGVDIELVVVDHP